jgi:hypothetical protein
MSPKSPEILANTPESEPKKVTDISREALAKRLGIDESALPDGKFFRIVDAQLDKLAWLDPAKKASELKAHLEKIDIAEAADKARELAGAGKQLLASETLEQSAGAVKLATEKLKTEWLTHGKEAVAAVGAIAWATSIDEATKGIDWLAKVLDWAGKTISSTIEGLKGILSSFWKMLWLDKLFKSIGSLFWLNSWVSSEAPGKSADESSEQVSNSPIQGGIDAITNKEKREKILVDYASWLWDMISREYFWWEKLSLDQLRRIQEILEKNLPIDILQKIQERYQKDGDIQVWEIATASIDLMAKFPASVVLELAFSNIIPYWAIVQKFAIEPWKSLINLTIDGLPFVDVPVSLDTFGNFIDQKLKAWDSHALDVARVQLYGASGLVWKLLWSVTAGVVWLGIMLTDTTTGVDGKSMLTAWLMKEYDKVADMFGKIEKRLWHPGLDKSDILKQYIWAVKEVQNNARIMQVVADNADDKVKMIAELKKLNSSTTGLNITWYIDELSQVTASESRYRDILKKMLVWREASTATYAQWFSRIAKEYLWGLDGATLQNLQKLDAIKARQVELIWSRWLKATLDNMKLALGSLTIARSADTMVIHLEDANDVSRFRAFLATIPGGIRGLAEVLPAASVIFSLGRIGYEWLKNEPWVDGEKGESFLDVLAYAVFPLYGTWSFLWSQRFNLRDFVSEGKIPPVTDLAVTSVLWGVALIEAKRVWWAMYDIGKWAYTLDWKRLTNGLRRVTYIDDLARSATTMVRGGRNIVALATKPSIRPELVKWIVNIAAKMPKRWRLAIGWVALAWLATGVAYAMWEDSPEEIQEQYRRDGYIDENGNPTEKLKSLFYQKTTEERKEILDALFILHEWSSGNIPKTHYEEWIYSLVEYAKKSTVIDSSFRKSLQSLGIDIQFRS